MTGKILEIENLTVSFGGFKALNNLNFSMDTGELRVIIGPNGAGKTTFLDVITGKVLLKAGQAFALVCRADAPAGDATQVGCSYLGLPRDVGPGDTLLLDDGLISLRVEKVAGDVVHTEVMTDGALSNRKG